MTEVTTSLTTGRVREELEVCLARGVRMVGAGSSLGEMLPSSDMVVGD